MKTYIGKGKRNAKFNGVIDVTINMDTASDFMFQGEKARFLRFSVSERKAPDEYGNTHSVSVWTPDAQPEQPQHAPVMVAEEAPKPTGRKRRKATA